MEPNIEADHSQLDSVRWNLIQRRKAKQRGSPSMKPTTGKEFEGMSLWTVVQSGNSQTFSTIREVGSFSFFRIRFVEEAASEQTGRRNQDQRRREISSGTKNG